MTTETKEVKTKKVEASKKEGKTVKVELPATKLEKKKVLVAKEITPVNNAALMEQVISKREIKYAYPEDCLDTLARKQFRQKVRNKIRSMENQLFKMVDKECRDYKRLSKKLKEYQNANVKPNVAV